MDREEERRCNEERPSLSFLLFFSFTPRNKKEREKEREKKEKVSKVEGEGAGCFTLRVAK